MGLQNRIIIFIPYCQIYKNFILDCLDSILNQDYSFFEIIIINDGSCDISHILEFIKNKQKIIMLNFEKNQGPAYSKWKFIEYIQQNKSQYNFNDIVCLIDGDDHLCTTDALSIINHTYLENKCWFTYGNAVGKFCSDINYPIPPTWNNIRKEKWIYNHPRTCKLGLLFNFKKEDFMMNDQWLTKGTDRPLVYNIIEWTGKSKCKNIPDIIYNYREHELNSYKTIDYFTKKAQLDYVCGLDPKEKIIEDIHIVMCLWKRLENIDLIIKNLNEQTVSQRIHFHILNNNMENYDILESKVKDCSPNNNIKISLSHYNNEFFGFQRFFYIRDTLIKNYCIDHVIIIDDDQLFENDWVENLYNIRKSKTFGVWYGKKWETNNLDYWNGSILRYTHCIKNQLNHITDLHYGATCGCIIDVSIFNHNSEIWNIPKDLPENITVYNIEDLWLSFIIRKIYGWNIERNFLKEKITLNVRNSNSIEQCLYQKLIKDKQQLLEYLVNKFGL